MDKDKENSKFDLENDPDFNDNFYKNIEKALGDSNAAEQEPEQEPIIELVKEAEDEINKAKEEPELEKDTTPLNEKSAEQPANEKLSESLQSDEEAEKDKIDDELTDINSSLAKQISNEMEQETAQIAKMKKKKLFWKIQSGVLLTLLCLVGFGFFFGFTKPGNSILMRLGVNLSGTLWDNMTNDFEDSTDVVADVDYLDEEDKSSEAPEVDPSTIVWPDHPGEGRQEEGVYNILLLGEEAIGMGEGRGRTDVIVIATLNTNDKTVKLTSLMRDMLVQIPGYKDNKLNTAFEKGGLDLLYETISLNFDLRLDGCIKVNFNKFEKIVDELGGLEITLKQVEVDYLNTTNYISNKKYRNVVVGSQLMNGNQVLGYARVRKISTITGNNNDYGRTDRHRIVLNAIYEKCKSKSKTDLLALMIKFLPMITTDVDKSCLQAMLNSYLDMGMNTKDIQQLRIPANDTFEDNVRVRGMSVLIPDLDANIEILHNFIFSDQVATPTPTAAASNTSN